MRLELDEAGVRRSWILEEAGVRRGWTTRIRRCGRVGCARAGSPPAAVGRPPAGVRSEAPRIATPHGCCAPSMWRWPRWDTRASLAVRREPPPPPHRGPSGARSHCRFLPPRIRLLPGSLTESVPLSLKRQCDNATNANPRSVGRCCACGGGAGVGPGVVAVVFCVLFIQRGRA
jgi:hypothetical protein